MTVPDKTTQYIDMYISNKKGVCLLLVIILLTISFNFEVFAKSLQDIARDDYFEAPSTKTQKEPNISTETGEKSRISKENSKETDESIKPTILSGKLIEIITETELNSEKIEVDEIIYVIDTKDFGLVKVQLKDKEIRNYLNYYIEVKGYFETNGEFFIEDIISSKIDSPTPIVHYEVEVLNRAGHPTKVETLGPPPTTDGHKILFILANFTNDTSQPVSVSQIRNTLYNNSNSSNAFYLFSSKQRFWLRGLQRPDFDIVNWVTLPRTNENCSQNYFSTWTTDAETIARSQGFEPLNYDSVALIFPKPQDCSLGAFATIGQPGVTNDKNKVWIIYGPSIGIDTNFSSIFTHELGHNLGLLHSNVVKNCQPGSNIFPQGCDDFEYGDLFSPMGGTPPLSRNFNNFHLYQLGWLSNTGKVAVIPEQGTYNLTLMSPASTTKRYQLVTFPLKNSDGSLTGQSAYLEFRRQILPFENFIGGQFNRNANYGISLRFGSTDTLNPAKSYLFDSHEGTWWFDDAAIEVGETYQNQTYGFSIRTNSTNPILGAAFTLQLSR